MSEAVLEVEVAYAVPDRAWRIALRLPAGATVADALAAADLPARIPGVVVDPGALAVFGQAATPETRLHPGDRVEVLRPLLADPKTARRRRAGDGRHGGRAG